MRWNKEEIEIALTLIKEGSSYKDISLVIKRSEASIRNKVYEFNIKSSTYKKIDNNKICLNCGENIENGLKFCSRSCSNTFNNKIVNKLEIFCGCCNKPLKNSRSLYCNSKCYRDYQDQIIFTKIENGDTSFSDKTCKRFLIHKYGNKCMECDWNKVNETTGKVPIQLEHIDGHSENNTLSNLKLLCPNCHSLTSTFGALNKGNGRKKRYKN
jgi:Zn finger protein HypA/HybF involved in hydrogenase expression